MKTSCGFHDLGFRKPTIIINCKKKGGKRKKIKNIIECSLQLRILNASTRIEKNKIKKWRLGAGLAKKTLKKFNNLHELIVFVTLISRFISCALLLLYLLLLLRLRI